MYLKNIIRVIRMKNAVIEMESMWDRLNRWQGLLGEIGREEERISWFNKISQVSDRVIRLKC